MTTLKSINTYLESKQGKGFRNHLGASLIGRPCARQLWYVFRWARPSSFEGRILRLFDRGNREESVIVSHLRKAGIHCLDVDPVTGAQFRIEDHDGHFGGSLDGKIYDAPEFPMLEILGEFKTHNDKSFKGVKKQGVRESKYEHYVQAQIYMDYEELPACLYFAVNKNDDELYIEVIMHDPETAGKHIDKAAKVIYSSEPPDRIPNASPGWYVCRFCDYTSICHQNLPKALNCRTCIHSEPIENNTWRCKNFDYILSKKEQELGCLEHRMIRED